MTYQKRTPEQCAIDSVEEFIGEPDWWADLRDRVIMSTKCDTPLEKLVRLGRKVKDKDDWHIRKEPRPVTVYRNHLERLLTPEDFPPGAPQPTWPRPDESNAAALERWQAALYASFE